MEHYFCPNCQREIAGAMCTTCGTLADVVSAIDLTAFPGIVRRDDGRLVTPAGYVLSEEDIAALQRGEDCTSTPECALCGPFRCLFRNWPTDLAWPDGTR